MYADRENMVSNRLKKILCLILFLSLTSIAFENGCIAASTFTIPSDADNTVRYWFTDSGTGWVDDAVTVGNLGIGVWSAYQVFESSFRFTSVSIPNGATITSAKLRIKTTNDISGAASCDLDIQACDEDNSAQMSSFANFGGRARTTANVNWTKTFAANTVYDTDDIKTVVQEIVDRGSWASGNAMQFIISDHTYKYSALPTTDRDEFSTLQSYGAYTSSLIVEYVAYTDIGLRIYDGSSVVKIGTQTLDGHALRVRKGDTTYGIPLLATDSADASSLRIFDGSAVKALPKVD